jgi:hypothetical protein
MRDSLAQAMFPGGVYHAQPPLRQLRTGAPARGAASALRPAEGQVALKALRGRARKEPGSSAPGVAYGPCALEPVADFPAMARRAWLRHALLSVPGRGLGAVRSCRRTRQPPSGTTRRSRDQGDSRACQPAGHRGSPRWGGRGAACAPGRLPGPKRLVPGGGAANPATPRDPPFVEAPAGAARGAYYPARASCVGREESHRSAPRMSRGVGAWLGQEACGWNLRAADFALRLRRAPGPFGYVARVALPRLEERSSPVSLVPERRRAISRGRNKGGGRW